MLNPSGEWGCYIPLKRKFYADYEMKGGKNIIIIKLLKDKTNTNASMEHVQFLLDNSNTCPKR